LDLRFVDVIQRCPIWTVPERGNSVFIRAVIARASRRRAIQ